MFLALACAAADPPGIPLDSGVEETVSGLWTVEEAETTALELLDQGIPHPNDIADVYLELMSHADSVCPMAEDPETFQGWWDDDCTTEQGYGFYGKALWRGKVEQGYGHVAAYTIVRPDGGRFVASGAANFEGIDGSLELGGVFWDSQDEGRLGKLIDSGLHVTPMEDRLEVDGGFSFGDGAGLHFAEVVLDDRCEGTPAEGQLRVRDPEGAWWVVAFEGCEPCAPASLSGEPAGTLCIAEATGEALADLESRL